MNPRPLRAHAAPLLVLLATGVALLHRATGRYFWNGDDAFELPMARLLSRGEFSAWWDASSMSGHTGLRVVPRFLWGLDHALWGPDAAGYYATNVGLHLLCILAVYGVAVQWTGSRLGATLGAAIFGFLGPTAQVVSFLSAREDAIATLAFLGAIALWPRARTSRRAHVGVGALYALICLSKLSGITLPGVLLAMDLAAEGRAALHPRTLLRRYGPLAGVLGLFVIAWEVLVGLGDAGSYAALRSGEGGPSVLLANLYQGLLHPLADHPGSHPTPRERALIVGQAVALPLAFALGLWRGGRTVAVAGLAWIGLGLLPPAALLGWNAEQSWGDGRYFHLPSAGLGVVIAAGGARLVGRARLLALPAALAGALTVAAFAHLVAPQFALQGEYTRHLARATEEAAQSLGPGGRLVLAWPRADQGVRRLIDGGFLRTVVPSLPPTVYVVRDGTRELLSVTPGEDLRLDDVMVVHTDFTLDTLVPGRDALVAQGVRAHPIFDRGRRFTPVDLPLEPRAPGGSTLRWDLRAGDAGWRLGPGLLGEGGYALQDPGSGRPPRRGPGGLALTTTGELDWPGNPEPPRALYLPELVSPPLTASADSICSLEIELTAPGPAAPPGGRLLEPPDFGVLSWVRQAQGPYMGGALAFPLERGSHRQTVHIDLGNSPSWRASGPIARLGLTPSARRAEVTLHTVSLVWCAAAPAPIPPDPG